MLDGAADHVALSGVDRWIGGVHLVGREVPWRWDEGVEDDRPVPTAAHSLPSMSIGGAARQAPGDDTIASTPSSHRHGTSRPTRCTPPIHRSTPLNATWSAAPSSTRRPASVSATAA